MPPHAVNLGIAVISLPRSRASHGCLQRVQIIGTPAEQSLNGPHPNVPPPRPLQVNAFVVPGGKVVVYTGVPPKHATGNMSKGGSRTGCWINSTGGSRSCCWVRQSASRQAHPAAPFNIETLQACCAW